MGEVTIKARSNGPYKVEGPVRVIDAQGDEFVLSHRRVGFVADDSAAARRRLGAASGDGQCGEDECLRRTHQTASARLLLLTPSPPASSSSPRS